MTSKHEFYPVLPGVEVFLQDHLDLIKGRRVGLLTNRASIDREKNSTIELFHKNPRVNLVALFGPEHGLGGDAQAGEYVPFVKNKRYDLPVYSLYGQDRSFEPDPLPDLDESMRAYDTQREGKSPAQDMLKKLDVLICDLQDVGTRVYTYAASMTYCMQACAEVQVEFILLDRPNPINGIDMEGPVLEYPAFSSFIGLYPIPLRHGMTMGEMALYFHSKFLRRKPPLNVIPMSGWRRDVWYDETWLPWVPPSPNMPYFKTAQVYPGQVLLEGTNISEGRGTPFPFEQFGAPWIQNELLCRRLNGLGIPGARFDPVGFTPTFSKYRGDHCEGCRLQITDRRIYRSFGTALHIISAVEDLYPGKLRFYDDYFDKVAGTHRLRTQIRKRTDTVTILQGFTGDIEKFGIERRPYLLYP